MIGKGKGKDERRRLGLAAVSENCRQSTFMRSHWSKSENLIALWKYPVSYLYPSISIYIPVHVADGGHLRGHAGAGPQKASFEQVHSTVEMVVILNHSFVMVASLASMAIELNIDCNT